MVVGCLWALTAGLWLLDAVSIGCQGGQGGQGGGGLPLPADRAVAGAALAGTALLLALAARRLWARGTEGRALLLLLVVAAVAYFTGLHREVTGRYFGDEGIYLAQARRINLEGQLLRPWFIYPHLLFYLDAFALWLAALFGGAVPALLGWLYGVRDAAAVEPLVTRMVTATMGAATVVPVFAGARRVAGGRGGRLAATLAGALVALSPILIDVAHLNISDVAGAFFAAMTVAECAALLRGESRGRYLRAGLWAGLAAGGKYPAGVVAVAIAGVWIGWRLRRRTLDPGLLWAALAAMAAFLATTPSLLAYPRAVLTGGGPDILFGVRQYARSGWTGVVRTSNALFYLGQLRFAFGLPALALGVIGAAGLRRPGRWRFLWLLPFPAAYLCLLVALEIAVPRNLLPVLPALALLLGAGAGGWPALARRLGLPRARTGARAGAQAAARVAAALAVIACLVLPAWRSAIAVVRFARPTTRELAARWIPEHLPPGSFLVQEVYTPQIEPVHLYPAIQPRFVNRLTPEELRDPSHDLVLVASDAYGRFFQQEELDDPYLEAGAARYREIFDTFEPVMEWRPDRLRAGPVLRLFEVDPAEPPWSDRAERSAAELLTAVPAMVERSEQDAAPARAVRFGARGQWALAKAYLEPGTYRVRIDGDRPTAGGSVQVLDRKGEEIAVDLLFDTSEARVTLSRRDKYFLYLRLPAGSLLRRVEVERERPDRNQEEDRATAAR